MGAGNVPKQYLSLGERSMLEHSINALLSDGRIDRVFVVVAPTDTRWQEITVDEERVEFLPVGGESRAESVRNGLIAIAARTGDDDRVLVHDAARPCLTEEQLGRLIDEVGDDGSGGLLAIPLADTLKRGEDGRVGITLERTDLWCAQTPQLFRVASLRAALGGTALDPITDEASAMERAGHAPRLVLGGVANLKVTTAEDLVLARAILAEQGRL
jgi:2-C-methyl-D-erythritol 4-phosphate cytidylyltransferase